MSKRERSLSNVADDDVIPLLLPTDTSKVIEIYKGSKNFWRARCNLELVFTYYVSFDCIQIRGYDNAQDVHTSALYVAATVANRKCQNASNFEDSFRTKRIELSRKKSRTSDNSQVPAMREYLCEYLLSRVDMVQTASPVSTASLLPPILSPGSYKPASVSSLMTMSSTSNDADEGDDEDADSVLLADVFEPTPDHGTPTIVLKWTPVSSDVMEVTPDKIVSFKLPYAMDCPKAMESDGLKMEKRASIKAADFEMALSCLKMEQSALTKANKEANRCLNLTQLGAAGFANSYAQRMKREAGYSRAKKLWHMAYRRICTRNYVKRVTDRLNKIYNNFYGGTNASTEAVLECSLDGAFVKPSGTTAGKTSSLMKGSSSLPRIQKKAGARHTIAVTSPKMKHKSMTEAAQSANRLTVLQTLQSAEDPSSPTATPRSRLVDDMPPMPVKG
jgi:hypothetical protein